MLYIIVFLPGPLKRDHFKGKVFQQVFLRGYYVSFPGEYIFCIVLYSPGSLWPPFVILIGSQVSSTCFKVRVYHHPGLHVYVFIRIHIIRYDIYIFVHITGSSGNVWKQSHSPKISLMYHESWEFRSQTKTQPKVGSKKIPTAGSNYGVVVLRKMSPNYEAYFNTKFSHPSIQMLRKKNTTIRYVFPGWCSQTEVKCI